MGQGSSHGAGQLSWGGAALMGRGSSHGVGQLSWGGAALMEEYVCLDNLKFWKELFKWKTCYCIYNLMHVRTFVDQLSMV